MEQFTCHDLSSVIQFGLAKKKMETYLARAARTLEPELSGVTMERKLDFESEEYVIEHIADDIELRFGFIWSYNEVHIAFELSLEHDFQVSDQILFRNGWSYHLARNHDIYYKCNKLTELMNGYNGQEEEFAITEFISSGCKQIVKSLKTPTS